MLEIKGLSYSYRRNIPVLHNINLVIKNGFNLLIGENGSGKTTLIKNLTSILPLQQGEILLDNLSVTCPEYKKKISYLPQSFDVYPTLPVKEILRFVASAKSGLNKSEQEEHISKIMDLTNITEYAQKKLKDCSEGMRRRVGIASALIGNPDFVVLDEPTAGIDPKERIQFYKTLRTCFNGKTVLISTHILDDIDFLATNVIMLSQGCIKYTGDYAAFRSTLKGKLFEATCDLQKLSSIIQKYHVLSTSITGELVTCKIVSEEAPQHDSQIISVVASEASVEDIWLYFQGGNTRNG